MVYVPPCSLHEIALKVRKGAWDAMARMRGVLTRCARCRVSIRRHARSGWGCWQTIQRAASASATRAASGPMGVDPHAVMLLINAAGNQAGIDAAIRIELAGVTAQVAALDAAIALAAGSPFPPAGLAALTGTIAATGLGAVNTGMVVSGAAATAQDVIDRVVGAR